MGTVEEMELAARQYIFAVSYPSASTEAALAASLAPGAEVPREGALVDRVRQSNWRCPEHGDHALRLVAVDEPIAICFGFDTQYRLTTVLLDDLELSPVRPG
jgi:hypothetical protein